MLRPRLVGDLDRRLTLVPLCAQLRYLVPPPSATHQQALADLVADVRDRSGRRQSILVYGDDLERTSGTGGWRTERGSYAATVRWVAEHPEVEAVHVEEWLETNPCDIGPIPPAGTYYELAVGWGAGENYRNWADDAQWRPFATVLRRAEEDLELALGDGCDARLAAVAERLNFIGNYETGWQERNQPGGTFAPTGWVQSCASQAASGLPVLAAARWAAGPTCQPIASKATLDTADPDLLILANDDLWCLVAPDNGARICLLAHRDRDLPHNDRNNPPGAALVVGNPADDWNLQQNSYRYMDEPAAHPGALTDPAQPHRRWEFDPPR